MWPGPLSCPFPYGLPGPRSQLPEDKESWKASSPEFRWGDGGRAALRTRGSSQLAFHPFGRYFLSACHVPATVWGEPDRQRWCQPSQAYLPGKAPVRHLVPSLPPCPGCLPARHLQGASKGAQRCVLTHPPLGDRGQSGASVYTVPESQAAECPITTRGQPWPPHSAHVWPRPARGSASSGLPHPPPPNMPD